jgi:hypothetical protein
VSGFSGELHLNNESVRVVPEKRNVTYRPRIELRLDETIDLTDSLGPFELSAFLVGQGTPTEIQARVIDPITELDSPIVARLNLPQLQPGELTAGNLSFYLPPDLAAAPYTARVLFTAVDGTPVEPGVVALELLLASADVKILTDESQLNFGYWLNPTEPITVPLKIEFASRAVNIGAEFTKLSSTVPLSATLRTVDTAAGPGPRPAVLALALNAAGERLPIGDITGVIKFGVTDAIGGTTAPAEIPFRLHRPGYWKVFFWCDPNNRVPFLPSVQSFACLLWPRQTRINESPVSPNWHLPSLLRLVALVFTVTFGVLMVRVRRTPYTYTPQRQKKLPVRTGPIKPEIKKTGASAPPKPPVSMRTPGGVPSKPPPPPNPVGGSGTRRSSSPPRPANVPPPGGGSSRSTPPLSPRTRPPAPPKR